MAENETKTAANFDPIDELEKLYGEVKTGIDSLMKKEHSFKTPDICHALTNRLHAAMQMLDIAHRLRNPR